MNKWIILNNGKEYTFDNFEEALKSFLITISNHLWKYSLNNREEGAVHVYDYSTLPDNIDAFFAYKYGERTITDEEIVLENRLKMLLDYMLSKNLKEKKENTLKSFKQSVHYKGEEKEISTKVKIDINYKEDEVILDLRCNDGDDTYFKTNAFIFNDDLTKYYFKSKQRITTSDDPLHLGKSVELNITLQPYDEDIKEKLYQKQQTETETYIIEQYRKYAHIDKCIKITEIDEWALNKVSAENNYDVHELRELLLKDHN